ncbi:MAG TPA: hypothetical protein VGR14_08485 [Verrucomicrobiae bacterium]|jgi:hypothetical protein|nr:hypothetical protein [Verrucomicrobiae bacterium]
MNAYERHLQERGLTEYIIDGSINPIKWAESKVRILFLLKETYGYQGCGIIKIEDCAYSWLEEARIKTYVKMVTLAAAIELGLKRGVPLPPVEINSLSGNHELLHGVLGRMAVVDIKKHSGESTSNDREIREESHKNASLLHAQIEELSPTILIAGGNVCWHSLTEDIGLFGPVSGCAKFDAVVCKNTVLCYSNHPAARRGGFDIHVLHRAVLSASNRN